MKLRRRAQRHEAEAAAYRALRNVMANPDSAENIHGWKGRVEAAEVILRARRRR